MMRFASSFLVALLLTTLGVAEKNAELVETSRHKGRSHKVKSSWSQFGATKDLKSLIQVDAKARYIGKVMADAKFEGIDAGPRDNHLHLKEILDKYDDVNDYQAMDSRQTMAIKMSMDDPFPYGGNPPPSQIHRGEFTGFAEFMLTSFDNTFDAIGKMIVDLKAPPEKAEFSVIDTNGDGDAPDGLISLQEWLKYYPRMIMIEADAESTTDKGCDSTEKRGRVNERIAVADAEYKAAVESFNQLQLANPGDEAGLILAAARIDSVSASGKFGQSETLTIDGEETQVKRWNCHETDGVLTKEEWRDMNVVGMDDASFDDCNADKTLAVIDGVTMTEQSIDWQELQTCFEGMHKPSMFWLRRMAKDEYNDADRNNDEKLTLDEFTEAESWTGGSSSSDKEKIQEEREIDCQEFEEAKKKEWIVDAMRANFDQINGDDAVIDREEWLTFSSFLTFKGREVFQSMDTMRDNIRDKDGDGSINRDEFREFMGVDESVANLAFSLADQDGNNNLDYAEVMALMIQDESSSRDTISEKFWETAESLTEEALYSEEA